MKYIVGFGRFWYDFIVGDAWEVAVGVVVTLALAWLAVRAGLAREAWPIVPLGVVIALAGSLYWQTRRE